MNEFETCENCNRTIGKLETAMVFKSSGVIHIVCPQCHAMLTAPAAGPAAPAPATAPAAQTDAPAAPPTNWGKAIFWLLFWLLFGGPLICTGGALLWIYSPGGAAFTAAMAVLISLSIIAEVALRRPTAPDAPSSNRPPDHRGIIM